jgi:halimadienyl-diphosphate synthase
MTNVMSEIHNLLKKMGAGYMSNTAYDTAWIARTRDIAPDLSVSLHWLSENQLPDGSWGAKDTIYYHDRIICTLAAMIALTFRGRRVEDKKQIENGLKALEWITSGATKGLASDTNGATVGFEMIAPTLIAEAEKLGIIKQQGNRILGRLGRLREAKISKLAGRKIDRQITPAFSAEMAGDDYLTMLDEAHLQEENGSVANSPSATAYFSSIVRKGDERGMSYLRSVIKEDGGVPFAAPFDIFERTWILWNLALTSNKEKDTLELCAPHLNYLASHWNQDTGVGFSATYTPKDGDDTSLAYDVLKYFNYDVDIKTVLNYEERDYFRCYHLELDSSVSVNVHVLAALKRAGFEKNHPSVQKIIRFLRANRVNGGYWLDKWHISPYYPTSHIIISGHGYDHEMCMDAVKWILSRQKSDGSWGSLAVSTAEETAYCIQALKIWDTYGGKVPKNRIQSAFLWLKKNSNLPYPDLWIGKTLYCPRYVVESSILSALELARQ